MKKIQWLLFIGMATVAPLIGDDAELQRLQKELDSYREKQMNIEMEAQQSMRTNWNQFTQDINASEEVEKHILELQDQIDKLKKTSSSSASQGQ